MCSYVVNDGKRLLYSTLCIYCICNLFTTYGMYKLCAYIYYDLVGLPSCRYLDVLKCMNLIKLFVMICCNFVFQCNWCLMSHPLNNEGNICKNKKSAWLSLEKIRAWVTFVRISLQMI